MNHFVHGISKLDCLWGRTGSLRCPWAPLIELIAQEFVVPFQIGLRHPAAKAPVRNKALASCKHTLISSVPRKRNVHRVLKQFRCICVYSRAHFSPLTLEIYQNPPNTPWNTTQHSVTCSEYRAILNVNYIITVLTLSAFHIWTRCLRPHLRCCNARIVLP